MGPVEEYRRYFIFTYTFATNDDAGHVRIQFGNIKVVAARNFPAWSEVKTEIECQLTAKCTLIPGSVVYSGHNEMAEADFYQFDL